MWLWFLVKGVSFTYGDCVVVVSCQRGFIHLWGFVNIVLLMISCQGVLFTDNFVLQYYICLRTENDGVYYNLLIFRIMCPEYFNIAQFKCVIFLWFLVVLNYRLYHFFNICLFT